MKFHSAGRDPSISAVTGIIEHIPALLVNHIHLRVGFETHADRASLRIMRIVKTAAVAEWRYVSDSSSRLGRCYRDRSPGLRLPSG